jgi:hypothetical protein
LPELANELKEQLAQQGETALAAQIDGLRIKSRCGCNDDFCASFYTRDIPGRPSDAGDHHCVVVNTDGLIILDVLDGTIRFIEVIDRPDVRAKLLDALPPTQGTRWLP